MTTAYALARRGLSVTLIDRSEEPARGASFANGAQLSYLYTDALASPAILRRLPWLISAADPAFRFNLSLDPDFLRWGLSFLRNCTAARFAANTMEGLTLALSSRSAMHELLARHPIEFGHAKRGKLHLYEDLAAFRAAVKLAEVKQGAGAIQVALAPAEAAALEPALEPVAGRLCGAIWSPDEEVGDPYLFCRGLLGHLREHYRVRVAFGTPASGIDLDGARPAVLLAGGTRLEAARLAVCTGVDAPRLMKPAGIRLPIWPLKGYSLTAPEGPLAPRVSITDVSRKLVFCGLSGKVRVAGLADLGRHDCAVDARRLHMLVSSARDSLPLAADYSRIESSWAGLRPMTPNSLPIIRRERCGVVLNVGHGSLGWTYAMGAAEQAADLALEAA